MDHSDPQMPVPVMPYAHGCERGDCQASLDQASDLFGVHLEYHHDPYELLFSTRDARDFCSSWQQAAGSKSWKSCELAYGPTADDYVAWKISTSKTNLIATPKNKATYGWRAWTQRWTPAPMDTRQCRVQVYGLIEYHQALGNITSCSQHIEDQVACTEDPDCSWVLFGINSGVAKKRTCQLEAGMHTHTHTDTSRETDQSQGKWMPKFQSGVCVKSWAYAPLWHLPVVTSKFEADSPHSDSLIIGHLRFKQFWPCRPTGIGDGARASGEIRAGIMAAWHKRRNKMQRMCMKTPSTSCSSTEAGRNCDIG